MSGGNVVKKFYCKIEGLEDEEFVEYISKDHVEAASQYAKDVSHQVSQQNRQLYVKDMTVVVWSPDDKEGWKVVVEIIHIRSM